MPIGPFGEIIGTTGTLEGLADGLRKYKSKVIAPRNPKLVKGQPPEFKVSQNLMHNFLNYIITFTMYLQYSTNI